MSLGFNNIFLTGYVIRCTYFTKSDIDYTRIEINNTTIHEGKRFSQELFLYLKGEKLILQEGTHLIVNCRLITRDKKTFLYIKEYSTSPAYKSETEDGITNG